MTDDPPPQGRLPLHRRVLWRLAWLFIACTFGLVMRVRVSGAGNVPQRGGALLVANHTTVMDFMMPSWGAWRPVFGIGAQRVFNLPVVGWLLRQLNGASVTQGVKDKGAVMHLVDAYQRGQLITMFPEGKRSWTGRPLPITPGSGRLVQRLGCPVVYCRILTGHLQHPRWARWPRLVPWRMEYDPPVHYPPEATADDINLDMARRLAIDPDVIPAPPRSFGFRLAEGLPAFLWACPSCYAVDALVVPPKDRNRVSCTACGAGWKVDLSTRLLPVAGVGPTMSVAQASDRIAAHYGRAVDEGRFARDGVVLEAEAGSISRLERRDPKPVPVMDGRIQMFADRLEVAGTTGGERLTIPYDQLQAAILEFRSMLVLRTAEATWLVAPGAQSPHKWHHFLCAQQRAAGLVVRT